MTLKLAQLPDRAPVKLLLKVEPKLLARLNACAVGVPELEAGWHHALSLAAELAATLSLDGRAELMAALSPAFSPIPAPSPPSSGG